MTLRSPTLELTIATIVDAFGQAKSNNTTTLLNRDLLLSISAPTALLGHNGSPPSRSLSMQASAAAAAAAAAVAVVDPRYTPMLSRLLDYPEMLPFAAGLHHQLASPGPVTAEVADGGLRPEASSAVVTPSSSRRVSSGRRFGQPGPGKRDRAVDKRRDPPHEATAPVSGVMAPGQSHEGTVESERDRAGEKRKAVQSSSASPASRAHGDRARRLGSRSVAAVVVPAITGRTARTRPHEVARPSSLDALVRPSSQQPQKQQSHQPPLQQQQQQQKEQKSLFSKGRDNLRPQVG
ncbi:unnamed protein product [Protopolystoma xenopodis]|uniref:Uncharacterized protein n=1 Tax=Protopolystoma xenopodis TaxID=117903 RepID=A0A448WQT7_9PLAT|nr:unnamed protein product [Protopolystoma xenopodis]